jgi:hypothetical protein
MRRIIKRTVTIVTTITWTISWRPKGTTSTNLKTQPVTADIPKTQVLFEGQPGPGEIEAALTKEVEVSEITTISNLRAD